MKTVAVLIFAIMFPTWGFSASTLPPIPTPHPERLKVAIVIDPPYTFKTDDGKWCGFNVDIWSEIARILKLDYELTEMQTSEILVALNNKTIDLCISAMFFTPEREAAFEFSVPLGSTHELLATLPDKIHNPWWSAFHMLFTWGALKIVILLLCLVAGVGCAVWLVERRKNPEHFGGTAAKGVGAGAYWVGSTLASGVCFGIPLKSTSGRIIGLCWMFTCTLALSALIASIASSFTLRRLQEVSVNRHEIMGLQLGTVEGSFSEGLARRIGGRITTFDNIEDALQALLGKQVEAISYDGATLRFYEQKRYNGEITLHPTDFATRLFFGFSMPTGSPLRRPINTTLLALMNTPFWDRCAEIYSIEGEYTEVKTRGTMKMPRARNL